MKDNQYVSAAPLLANSRLPRPLMLAERLKQTAQIPLHHAAADELIRLHAAMAQQADRQRVPEGWREQLESIRRAIILRPIPMPVARHCLEALDAMLAAAPEAPAQARYFEQYPGQPIEEIDEQRFNRTPEDCRFKLYTAAPEAPAQASAVDERDRKDAERYQGVRCMCVLTGCRAGPGCPHYCDHCKQHIAALAQKGGAAEAQWERKKPDDTEGGEP